ncbi:(Fe-S)-binding protein [Pseudodesulfovibrio sediminis]|uniref:Lactate utilization protein A n=1 Tax=Pseudodesulfovibrio sediminis TaxID=2810563 RepID=A0ABN6EUI4_9BACT|nr:(Fe-S)-binding protein [Pseudodesulfovibrio sediminis]BCS89133.1 lactate utilization protein A [Pseudodesulfovibrio sediminis]
MTKHTATLFIQCLVDSLKPEIGDAMVHVLDTLGVSMVYPENQTCCGQPAFNSGYRREATKAARRFIDIFENHNAIVCPSGSCVHMVRHHYLDLFRDEPAMLARARKVAANTYEFTEYLVDVLGVTDPGSQLNSRFDGSVTYHDSCHLSRGLGIRSQPRLLLENIPGLSLIEMDESDRCCGFGGTFSVKYPEISTAMVDDKIQTILATGADAVAGCDVSCLMNIEGRLSRIDSPVRALHIAEILANTGK